MDRRGRRGSRDERGTIGGVVRARALIIVNPTAGRSRSGQRLVARVAAALQRRGCTAVVRRAGSQAGDTERLARDAEPEFDVIVAAGGDGTLNAVANGIAAAPRPLALLPLGTANVTAHEIGSPKDPELLAELIASGPVQAIWPGRVGDRLFLSTASSGFDAEVVATVNPRLKARLGRFAFAWAIIVRLIRYRPHDISVLVDGAEHRAAALIATTGRFYAGPFVVAPEGDPAAPVLDLVLFRRSGRLAVIRYLAALLRGRLPVRRDVTLLRARKVQIGGVDSIPVQADGEIVGQLPVQISVAERQLRLVWPRGSRFDALV